MNKRFYTVIRDLHLYGGLFLVPFLLLFSVSVVFLVHAWIPRQAPGPARAVSALRLPQNLESLNGRAQVDALRTVLPALGVQGEIGFVRHIPRQRRLVFDVSVPGRESTVVIDVASQTASITSRDSGVWAGLAMLHKAPGQHLVAIRMNWFPMRVWRWFADGTVYLTLFLTLSGIYLWAVLRAERSVGLVLLAAGALSFIGLTYAVVH